MVKGWWSLIKQITPLLCFVALVANLLLMCSKGEAIGVKEKRETYEKDLQMLEDSLVKQKAELSLLEDRLSKERKLNETKEHEVKIIYRTLPSRTARELELFFDTLSAEGDYRLR